MVMGLDRNTKTPCGFCFVEYFRREDTEDAVRYINGCKLDDRIVRVDWDAGFVEGRQYGRGRSGGQVREEYRTDYDAGRGGWGRAAEESQLGSAAPSRSPALPNSFGARRHSGGDSARFGAERGGADEPGAKRSKQEANPRFREREADEEDDD